MDSRRPQKVSTFHICWSNLKFRSPEARAVTSIADEIQNVGIVSRRKSKMSKSSEDQTQNEPLPRKHNMNIFRANNPPEMSRSGRPCQCCRQEKCAEKVFLNDNLRMIS